ncbi:hypothetical protein E2C01_037634 [Portunus trituberculatus]|uniref:Uncharacterized protein n=1 Tax=Portunus trituberculatus TaxID=210409 RepID=A0A5B7FEJ8_PORTR|nr:hypothetical protein [Portunus trituberculatus]
MKKARVVALTARNTLRRRPPRPAPPLPTRLPLCHGPCQPPTAPPRPQYTHRGARSDSSVTCTHTWPPQMFVYLLQKLMWRIEIVKTVAINLLTTIDPS